MITVSVRLVVTAILALIGIAAFIIGLGFEFGTARRMGPGFFPLVLSAILTIFVLCEIVSSLLKPEVQHLDWRPLIAILSAVPAFAVTMHLFGMIPAFVAVIGLSTLSERSFGWLPTLVLADFGAEVIKVEHVQGGDDVRRMGLPHLAPDGSETTQTSSFLAMNRGKKSLAIDLSKPEEQEIIAALVTEADVLIENFKVGYLARFNLDYETLVRINPKLVYCCITGFGQTGPACTSAGL